MGQSHLMDRFMTLCDWVYRLSILQLLWFVFTLLGGIVLGIFPATAALFASLRKLQNGESIHLLSTFVKAYRAEFWKSQQLGYLYLCTGLFIYIDLLLLISYQHPVAMIGIVLFTSLFILFLSASMYVFPIYAHFRMTLGTMIKLSFFLAVTQPLLTLGMALGTVLIYCILWFIPGLQLFLSISVFCFVYMKLASIGFEKIQKSGFIKDRYEAELGA
ncbi:YesL family protein [Bacillus horti]|uniref:Membrane protein YesL n=1 Tax=Caldalkalibacillus horti TaxID=77523 RepID=A0ABT9VW25_9BACI|nr:DUF624 domain-containing protein [Bacillus horti]MDQ0165203.1 putative membrane protein YesL [Bacillus horti]